MNRIEGKVLVPLHLTALPVEFSCHSWHSLCCSLGLGINPSQAGAAGSAQRPLLWSAQPQQLLRATLLPDRPRAAWRSRPSKTKGCQPKFHTWHHGDFHSPSLSHTSVPSPACQPLMGLQDAASCSHSSEPAGRQHNHGPGAPRYSQRCSPRHPWPPSAAHPRGATQLWIPQHIPVPPSTSQQCHTPLDSPAHPRGAPHLCIRQHIPLPAGSEHCWIPQQIQVHSSTCRCPQALNTAGFPIASRCPQAPNIAVPPSTCRYPQALNTPDPQHMPVPPASGASSAVSTAESSAPGGLRLRGTAESSACSRSARGCPGCVPPARVCPPRPGVSPQARCASPRSGSAPAPRVPPGGSVSPRFHPAVPAVRPEPVVALEGLVPQQQIAEAVAGRQGQHLGLQLRHLQGGDVQNDPALAAPAAVPAAAAAGRREPAGEKGTAVMGRGGEGEPCPALPTPPPTPPPAPAPPPGPAPLLPHPPHLPHPRPRLHRGAGGRAPPAERSPRGHWAARGSAERPEGWAGSPGAPRRAAPGTGHLLLSRRATESKRSQWKSPIAGRE